MPEHENGPLLRVATGLSFANRVGSLRRCILASIIGVVIGSPLAYGIAVVRDDIIAAMAGGAVNGLTLGIAQRSVMRRVPYAGWWVVANVVAFTAAFTCAFALGGEGHETRVLLSSSAAYTLITVVPLLWLVHGKENLVHTGA